MRCFKSLKNAVRAYRSIIIERGLIMKKFENHVQEIKYKVQKVIEDLLFQKIQDEFVK